VILSKVPHCHGSTLGLPFLLGRGLTKNYRAPRSLTRIIRTARRLAPNDRAPERLRGGIGRSRAIVLGAIEQPTAAASPALAPILSHLKNCVL
jgi:hypothetical protein